MQRRKLLNILHHSPKLILHPRKQLHLSAHSCYLGVFCTNALASLEQLSKFRMNFYQGLSLVAPRCLAVLQTKQHQQRHPNAFQCVWLWEKQNSEKQLGLLLGLALEEHPGVHRAKRQKQCILGFLFLPVKCHCSLLVLYCHWDFKDG